MSDIIDVSVSCGEKAGPLFGAGVRTIIRYYSRDTIRPTKRLTLAEAHQFVAAGLRIGIVHEGRHGDQSGNFNYECGFADGQYAQRYGLDTIGQPPGTAIDYGVDFDASATQIRDLILPYFKELSMVRRPLADRSTTLASMAAAAPVLRSSRLGLRLKPGSPSRPVGAATISFFPQMFGQ